MNQLLKPALYLNAIIVTIVAVVIFLLHAAPLTKDEPILASRMADMYLAFAVICVLVAGRYQKDRSWLLVPILINVAELANNLVQLVLRSANANVPTDPQLLPPLLLTGIFSVFYVVAYMGLTDSTA